MKKIAYCLLALILILALATGVALINLSSITTYAVDKLTNGVVHVSKADIAYRAGIVIADLSDVRIKKDGMEGFTRACRFVVGLDRVPYVKQASVSDFEVSIPPDFDLSFLGTGKGSFLTPREMIELRRGAITFGKQRFDIDRLRAYNLRGGKPFSFELGVRNDDLFGKLEASGKGGPYGGLDTDLKGKLSVTSLNLNRLDRSMQGRARTEGTFSLEKKRIVFEAPFELSDYRLRDPIFRNQFFVAQARGRFSCSYSKDTIDIKIRESAYKGTSLALDLTFRNDKLATLEISSGLLDVQDVKDLIAFDTIVDTDLDFWNYVESGKVGIRKVVYAPGKRSYADLELKGATLFYNDMKFTDGEAELSLDTKELRLSGGKASYRESSFYDVAGTVPLVSGKDISARGSYLFSLKDLPPLPELSGLGFTRGKTEGVLQIEGSREKGVKIEGTGRLDDAGVMWKDQSFTAKGSYSFDSKGIAFDPLRISIGLTDIAIRGKGDRESVTLKAEGNLDTDQIKPFLTVPLDMNGIIGLVLNIDKKGVVLRVDGDLSMDGLIFEVPNVMRKDRGVKSAASLTVVKGEEGIRVERLLYNLDVIDVKAKGDVRPDKTIDADLMIDVPEIEKIAHLFLLDEQLTKGSVDLNLSLRGLQFPLKKLPYIEGYARINNGFLRLPWVAKPLKEVNLVSDFKGENFNVKVDGLKYGASVVNRGTLRFEGLETPRFSLYVDMDNLDLDDFLGKNPSIRQIDASSLMAKASGDINVRAKKVRKGGFDGQYLNVSGLISGRKLNVSEFKMNALDGNGDMIGSVDLSGKTPRVYVNGRLNRMRSGQLMKALGAKTELADGRTSISGRIESEGATVAELAGNASGDAALYSRNGSILKWNLLSKVLGLLNVYDVFRGKAGLGKEGLPYNKMGATFVAKNGAFYTKDFLIDSPSMVITGEGEVDLKKDSMDGTIKVSPLVALDRTIDKIPILRNILQGKGRGFLSVAYNVKGPMDDPDIRASVVKTIGGKALDILRNILVLPKELFEGTQN